MFINSEHFSVFTFRNILCPWGPSRVVLRGNVSEGPSEDGPTGPQGPSAGVRTGKGRRTIQQVVRVDNISRTHGTLNPLPYFSHSTTHSDHEFIESLVILY